MKKIPIWVKASERLPDMEKAREPYYRFDGNKSVGFLRKLPTGIVIFLEEFEVDADGDEAYIIIEDLSRVEWLDEVEVPDSVVALMTKLFEENPTKMVSLMISEVCKMVVNANSSDSVFSQEQDINGHRYKCEIEIKTSKVWQKLTQP